MALLKVTEWKEEKFPLGITGTDHPKPRLQDWMFLEDLVSAEAPVTPAPKAMPLDEYIARLRDGIKSSLTAKRRHQHFCKT